MQTIPFIDLKKQYQNLKSEITPRVEKVLEESSFILGEVVENFEKNVSDYLGQKSLGCASGSDALLLSLMAIGIKMGDEVITTPFTFFATAGAVARLGVKPVFVDINENDFNIDVSKIEAVITKKTKAILIVHLFGQAVDMDSIMSLAKKHNLKVIEDACQAFGAEYKGKKVGTIGDFGCFSFFPTKNLGGAGDGGLITCKSLIDYELIKKLRVHGSKNKYFHEYIGINSRLDAIQAAILDVKLAYVDNWNEKRREIASKYSKELSDFVRTPQRNDYAKHIYHQYAVLTDRRDESLSRLQENGVAAGVYYPLPLHLQDCFKYLNYAQGDFPITEEVSKQILSLPIYPEMTGAQIDYVIKSMKSFFV